MWTATAEFLVVLIADEHKITKYDVIIVLNTISLHYIHFSATKIESSKSVAVSKRPDYTRLLAAGVGISNENY